ncbi:bifunctional folylpolyglutamate synthase/dihydrofolate synthase [Desulfovermiculus halophilus]|uniref:bifunctional folylpolyglutamate synthase/dihydrofolate synthase n=1 Tax=Desulfovermiculus halophilus TaxID=339722 RepID=UPI000481E7A1|nr:folylpolyglutamate synthase/dihydrofolate synthase family protein [Desulfovermiculus halophilus]
MTGTNPSYAACLNEFYALQKFGIKFGLSSTSALLDRLENPEQGQHFVHIAGTNGKGSVASFLAQILRSAGLNVGLYTSPHLVRFTERFQINGREIPQDQAADLMHTVMEVFDPREPPTFFEAVTVMALLYFARRNTDIVIMETGMGGRLDATNVIHPLVSVITSISMEHQEYLGSSLLQVAREKAGIIKPSVPVLTAASQPKVLECIQETCRAQDAPFYRLGRDFRARMRDSRLFYHGLHAELKAVPLGLSGRHQARNAALALAASEILEDKGFLVSDVSRRTGVSQTVWPGRMHLMDGRPRIMLDGAHNPAAIAALAASLRENPNYRRLILVIGIMADKAAKPILRSILPLAGQVIFTRPVYPRAMDPFQLRDQAERLPSRNTVIPSLPKALDTARAAAGDQDLILVTGSLFTVGEALSYLDPAAWAPDPA